MRVYVWITLQCAVESTNNMLGAVTDMAIHLALCGALPKHCIELARHVVCMVFNVYTLLCVRVCHVCLALGQHFVCVVA